LIFGFGKLKLKGKKPPLELLNEKNFENYFTKLKGVIFEFFEKKIFT
jgi:hypothetical protein